MTLLVAESLSLFSESLAGKRVLLMGGAPCDCSSFSSYSDFDVRISINNHVDWVLTEAIFSTVIPSREISKRRLDKLQYYFFDVENLNIEDIPTRVNTLLIPFSCAVSKEVNPRGFEYEWCSALARDMKTRPLTGMIALERILASYCKSVFLTGFNFYSDDGLRVPYSFGAHNIENNFKWFVDKYLTDKRMILDDKLQILVDTNLDWFPEKEIVRVEKDSIGRWWRK